MKFKLVVLVLFAFTINLQAQRKPNVILIFTDDQGTLDVNCYGAKDLVTPNMDRIAKQGIRFTQFYAAAPICSPSRAGLLTGKPPHAAGVPGNVSPGSMGMSASEVTIAEVLKEAGYATAHIGKWHLGHHEETLSNGQGFDYSFGHHGGCIDNYSHFFYWNGPNRHDLYRNGEEVHYPSQFFPDLMVKEARQFMKANRGKSFFIYFPINVPHYPYQGDVKWLEHYKALPMPRRLYAAFLSTMDERIGQLTNTVKELGLEQDTIIIFQSDHGHSVETRAFGGGGFAGPYRGAKGSVLEGGIRVPAMISWPGKIPQGEVRDQLGAYCDWFPTILDLCGIEQPEHKIYGKTLLPIIRSADAPTQHAIFNCQLGKQWVVREGDWKLCKTKNEFGLFNIAKDPAESKNLIKKNTEIVERLKVHREDWLNNWN